MRPRLTDPYSVPNLQQDNAIRENKALQRKLERSAKVCEGLQQGYDDMKDTQKMINRELKQKEDEVLQSRETIRIMGLDAARREKDLQNLRTSSANTIRELKNQRDSAYEAHRLNQQ